MVQAQGDQQHLREKEEDWLEIWATFETSFKLDLEKDEKKIPSESGSNWVLLSRVACKSPLVWKSGLTWEARLP